MRLLADHYLSKVASLGSPGVDELRWTKSVRPRRRAPRASLDSLGTAITVQTGSWSRAVTYRDAEPSRRHRHESGSAQYPTVQHVRCPTERGVRLLQPSPARSAADATIHTEPNASKYPHEHASRSLRSRAAGYLILAVRRCIRRCLRPSMMSRIHRGVLPRLTIIVFDATWDKLSARSSPGSWPISSEWRGQSLRSAGPPFCPESPWPSGRRNSDRGSPAPGR